jgi:outer membrane receptor protein involved in Fe transport
MTARFRRQLLATTLLVSAGTFAAPASAQDTSTAVASAAQSSEEDGTSTSADGSPTEGGEIVVTGSRIARPELEAATPVQVLSSAAIEQQGSPNVADILSELPAVGIGSTRTNTNFSTIANGVSTIDLRNLDEKRTLVLQNGRRIVAGIGGTSSVDVNNIPIDLLERIEIITGGASAVYGSEAVAGVVNFILRNDFEGVRVRAQAGVTDEGDNPRQLIAVTGGYNFGDDRGNITLSGQYDRDEGLRSRNRAISRNDVPFRSSFTPQGRFFAGDSNFTYDQANNLQVGFVNGVNGFNRNAERYIAVPLERYLANGLAHFDFTDSISLFAEGSYAKAKSRSRLEPYAFDNSDARLPDGTILPGLSIDNPFVPTVIRNAAIAAGEDTIGFTKRFVGVFDRSNRADREFYRIVAGLRGSFLEDWKWEAYYNRSQTQESTASETGLRDRLYYALDVINLNGQPACRDAAARTAGCRPFNVFGFDSASPEARAYVTNNGQLSTYESTVRQEVFAANVSGSLFNLPGGELGVAAGLEHRKEKSRELYDDETQAGNTLSNALTDTVGEYDVTEAYGEVVVPILADRPFFEYLGLEAAARYSDYSTVGGVWSYKIGGDWAPTRDIRFRAVYARASRAPNIGELFAGASQTFPSGLTDPCEGVTATSTRAVDAYCRTIPGIAQQIASRGVFQYDDNLDRQSIEGEDSGNTDLDEERAKTLTAGVVLTPRFLPNFSLTVDYFQIKIKDAITLVPRQVTIDECAASAGTSPLCDLIVREVVGTPRPRTPGTVFQVDSFPVNAASIETRGIDVGARYRTNLGADSRIDLAVQYTYLDRLTLQPLEGLPVENNRGQLDGDGRLGAGFKHKANASATFTNGPFSFNWRTVYLSDIKDTLGPDEDSPLGDETNSVDDYWYHDIQARFTVGDARRLEFYVGVDNLFDKKPPVINQNGASNITGTETAADTYDPFGRNFYAGVSVKF